MKKIIIFLIMSISIVQVKPQMSSLTSPSPEAASLGYISNIPVSLHTGTISPTIDLLDLAENDFHLLMNLTYTMSGARLDLQPGWVGSNWNLNVGGVVTRVINGIPDETSNGLGYLYCADKINDLDWLRWNTSAFAKEYNQYFMIGKPDSNDYDTAPDDFYFQANGISGHFFIGKNKEIHVVGQPNIKVEIDFYDMVEYTFSTTFHRIKIIMDDGTIYHYGGAFNNIDSSSIHGEEYSGLYYANAWHLEKITLPNGKEIKLKYTNFYSDAWLSMSYLNVSPTGDFYGTHAYAMNSFINHCYLESIESENYKISFKSSKMNVNSEEESWRRLDEIVVLDKSIDKIFRRFTFAHSGHYLVSLQESGEDCINILPPYEFTYNGALYVSKPAFSPCRDIWGYYKAYCTSDIPEVILDEDGERYFSLEKQPSLNSTQKGILNQIKYPSGGLVKFEYELNDYSRYYEYSRFKKGMYNVKKSFGDADHAKSTQLQNGEALTLSGIAYVRVIIIDEMMTDEHSCSLRLSPGTYDKIFFFRQAGLEISEDKMKEYRFMLEYKELLPSLNEKCGGLRIKKIIYKENESDKGKVHEYKYITEYHPQIESELAIQSSGILGCKPLFEYAFSENGHSIAQWSMTITAPQLTEGSPVGYSEVAEIISDGNGNQGGYIKYYYSNFDKYPDLLPIMFWNTVFNDSGARESQAYKRGKLLKKEIYSAEGKLIQSVEHFYKSLNEKTTIALTYKELPIIGGGQYYYLFGYFGASNKYATSYLPIEELNIDYLNPGIVKQRVKYEYNEYNQVIKKDIENSNGDHLITRYKYPQDYLHDESSDRDDAYVRMFNKHIISPVIEEETLKNSVIIQREKRSYYYNENDIFFLKSLGKNYDPTSLEFRADIYYTECDSRGNRICSHTNNGLQTVYLWGYNYKYLVAIIENATRIEVEAIIGSLENYASQPIPDISKIELLRKNLKYAQITSYTYKPYVGVLTQTDIAGHTIYYEYDALGRLCAIYDENHHKINTYKYHYRKNN